MKLAIMSGLMTFTIVLAASVNAWFAAVGAVILAIVVVRSVKTQQQAMLEATKHHEFQKIRAREALARAHVRIVQDGNDG